MGYSMKHQETQKNRDLVDEFVKFSANPVCCTKGPSARENGEIGP